MTITIVTVPKWGLAMEEGRVTAWHIAAGAEVTAGADLVDIETSKIANTLEAPASGMLRRIMAQGDAMLPCGSAIAVIAGAEATEADIDDALSSHQLAPAEGVTSLSSGAAHRDVAVSVNGVAASLRAFEAGDGGIPAVFLHGFGGDARTWSLLQGEIAAERRTIALDLPGHGGSTKQLPDWSAPALARMVCAVLDELGIARCHLVAHSMGAVVARELAAHDSDRAVSLAAFAPADLGLLDPAYVAAFRAAKRRSQMSQALQMLFADPASVSSDMAEDLLRFRRIDGVDAALAALDAAILADAAATDPGAAAIWSGLGRRALAVWGAQDRVVSAPDRAVIPDNCGWSVLAHAGHMAFVEQPGAAAALVKTHMEANEQ